MRFAKAGALNPGPVDEVPKARLPAEEPQTHGSRRLAEERAKGGNVTLDEILASQQDRDHGDTHRELGAMRQAEGAELLDTDGMDREAVLAVLLGWIEARRPAPPTAAGARPPHA